MEGRHDPHRAPPPRDMGELRARAEALRGVALAELEASLRFSTAGEPIRTKGKVGELLERALGASGGAGAVHDFPGLGVELKTIPLDERGVPRESTFVCALSVADADMAEWETSWTRAKLSHVLWVPIETRGAVKVVGAPMFWRPTPPQEGILKADFDDIVGLIGIGGIEALTARDGRWLQVRPKAAHGRVRTVAYGGDGVPLETVPRGFYLRARFTRALLADPRTTLGADDSGEE